MKNIISRIEELVTNSQAGYLRVADADEIIFHCKALNKQLSKQTTPAEKTFNHAGMNYTRSYGVLPAAQRQQVTICKP